MVDDLAKVKQTRKLGIHDRPFDSYGALKSVAQGTSTTLNSSIDGFGGSKIVEGLVGYFFFIQEGKEHRFLRLKRLDL